MTDKKNGKVVSRTIAVALSLICVVLSAGLVTVVVNGAVFGDQQTIDDLQAQVTNQTSTISNLNAQITIIQNQLTSLNTTVNDYEDQIANLTTQINQYLSILDLNESAIIIDNQTITQDANTTTSLYNDAINYAGYVKVQVQSSSNTTYVQVIYTCAGVNFNQKTVVGTDGTAYFPILPSTTEILLGNTDSAANNATVTLTYYY